MTLGRGSGRRWLRWTIAAALVVAVVGAAATLEELASRPTVSKRDVGAIVDGKVGAAVHTLQSAPAPGVGVFNAIRGPFVVIQATGPSSPKGGGELGSGIIVSAQGAILTALHVVEGSTAITVSFSDGSQSPATIETTDADHDSAVLAAQHLPEMVVPAVLGGGARIGDQTFAVGNPVGLAGSLTEGVISGVDRSFKLPNGRMLTGLIQFDAAVNPGSSGGPLLNRQGQVIGIVTGLVNPTGAGNFAGIGFAMPIAAAGGAAGAPAR